MDWLRAAQDEYVMVNHSRSFAFIAFCGALLGALLLTCFAFGEGEKRPSEAELNSAKWWRGQAMRYAVNATDAEVQAEIWYRLAYAFARANEFENAKQGAANVANAQKSVYAFAFIAKQQLAGQDAAAAAETLSLAAEVGIAEAKKDPAQSASGFINQHLVTAFFDHGLPERARAYVDAFPPSLQKRQAYIQIATELAKQGKLDEALAMEPLIPSRGPRFNFTDEANRESFLTEVAMGSARAGRIDDTIRCIGLLNENKNNENRNQEIVYSALAQTLVESNQLDKAEQIIARMNDSTRRANATAQLRAKQLEKLNLQDLLAYIEKVDTREEKLALLQKLFEKQVTAKDLPAAEATIAATIDVIESSPRAATASKFGETNDEIMKMWVKAQHTKIAAGLAAKGDREAARKHLAIAEEAAAQIPDSAGLTKIVLLESLVETQLQLGEVERAKSLLENLPEGDLRTFLAARMATAAAQANDPKSALEMAKKIASSNGAAGSKSTAISNSKTHEYGKVVATLVRNKQLDAAKTILQNLNNTSADVSAYFDWGNSLVSTGQSQELGRWLENSPSAAASAYACLGAAEAAAK